jgi:hypothetical protein
VIFFIRTVMKMERLCMKHAAYVTIICHLSLRRENQHKHHRKNLLGFRKPLQKLRVNVRMKLAGSLMMLKDMDVNQFAQSFVRCSVPLGTTVSTPSPHAASVGTIRYLHRLPALNQVLFQVPHLL